MTEHSNTEFKTKLLWFTLIVVAPFFAVLINLIAFFQLFSEPDVISESKWQETIAHHKPSHNSAKSGEEAPLGLDRDRC